MLTTVVLSLLLLTTVIGNEAAASGMSVACPLDGTRFRRQPFSVGTITGWRLDLRPIGTHAAVPPSAHCPTCHFVFRAEPERRTKATLRRVVSSQAYQKAVSFGSDALLLALLGRALGQPHEWLARLHLEATWESEGDPRAWRALAEKAINAHAQVARSEDPYDDAWRTAQVIQVELLRRLGRFAEADAKLRELMSHRAFRRGVYAKILPRQRELIDQQDPAPHDMPPFVEANEREDDPAWVMLTDLFGDGIPPDIVAAQLTKDALLLTQHRPLGGGTLILERAVKVAGGTPRATADEIVKEADRIQAEIAGLPFVREWLDVAIDRKVTWSLLDPRPHDGDGWYSWFRRAWQVAGLERRPVHQLDFSSEKWLRGQMFFTRNFRRGIITDFNNLEPGHWLDELDLQVSEYSPSFVAIDAKGARRMLSIGRKRPVRGGAVLDDPLFRRLR